MRSLDDDLADYSVEEAVLWAAEDLLKAEAGLQTLPFFAVRKFNEQGVDNEDGDRPGTVTIQCEFDGSDHWFPEDQLEFELPLAVIKGIALRRSTAIKAFTEEFLPVYRAQAAAGMLSLYLAGRIDLPPDFGDGQTPPSYMVDLWEELEREWPNDLEGWSVVRVTSNPVSKLLFDIEVTCQDHNFYDKLKQQAACKFTGVDGDLVTVPLDFSWRDFEVYRTEFPVRRALLERIVRGLRSAIAAGEFKYSREASDQIRAVDEGEDCEDPFSTGELVEDRDGRVHFPSDLYDR